MNWRGGTMPVAFCLPHTQHSSLLLLSQFPNDDRTLWEGGKKEKKVESSNFVPGTRAARQQSNQGMQIGFAKTQKNV